MITASLGACATTRQRVALRQADDLRAVDAGRYALPDSVPARSKAYGVLEQDSVVFYRIRSSELGGQDADLYLREARAARSGVPISGFTRADGRYVRYEGTVRRDGDVLVFEPRPRRSLDAPLETQRVPVSEIQSVDAHVASVGNTVLMVSLMGIMALAALAASISAGFDQSAM